MFGDAVDLRIPRRIHAMLKLRQYLGDVQHNAEAETIYYLRFTFHEFYLLFIALQGTIPQPLTRAYSARSLPHENVLANWE
jgi:hypothetical protein